MHHYFNAMRNYAVFKGRASRREFWFYTLTVIILAVVVSVIDQGMIHPLSPMSGVLPGLFTFVHLLPSLAVQVRRLHDADRTGWWILLNVTGIGVIITLIFALLRGTAGPNRYGPVPEISDVDIDAKSVGDQLAGADPVVAAPSAAFRRDVDHRDYEGRRRTASNAATSTSQGKQDAVAGLERLAKLRDNGSITEAEFATMKRQLIGR